MTLLELFKAELKALFTNPVVMLTMIGGVVFYSFLYPLPYSHQT
ncbi:ABC transporter permease, partial [Vibrio furnissii]